MPFLLRCALLCLVTLLPAARGEQPPQRTLMFYGDSLTAGYGLDDPSTQAFPGLIQARIDEAGLPWRVVNAGLSGETSAGGLRRIDWVLRQPVDIFVLELGGNDGLRGLPVDMITANLQAILDRVKARYPDARLVVAGMRMPASMGDYAETFNALFAPLAAANDAGLIPFLLEGVGGVPHLNLPDGVHPNVAGMRRVADTVWPHLADLLREN
jgi:acyl-CoA thioesterase I